MVTYLQFYKAVKSYYYRQSLFESMNELESKIVNFLKEREVFEIKIPGYFVSLRNGELLIANNPDIILNQLEIEFKEKEVQ